MQYILSEEELWARDKEMLIKFMEWQMEKKPLIANFTHNVLANRFLDEQEKEESATIYSKTR